MCSLTVCTVSADGTIITVSTLWITLRKSLYILKKSYDIKCNVLTVCTVYRFDQSKTGISIRSVMFYCLSTCVVVRTVRFVSNKWHILYAYNYRFRTAQQTNSCVRCAVSCFIVSCSVFVLFGNRSGNRQIVKVLIILLFCIALVT